MDICGDVGCQVITKFCKKLRKLTHRGWVTQMGLISLAQGCPNLDYLEVQLLYISNEALECVGTHLKNLRDFRIWLSNKDGITDSSLDNGVRAMLMGCSKLERLDINNCFGGLTDVGLGYIGKYGHNLRYLCLCNTGESDKGLLELSKGCPRLRKLRLSGCPFSDQAVATFPLNIFPLRYVWVEKRVITRPMVSAEPKLKSIGGPDSVERAFDRACAVAKRVEFLRAIQSEHDELEAKFFEERAALEANIRNYMHHCIQRWVGGGSTPRPTVQPLSLQWARHLSASCKFLPEQPAAATLISQARSTRQTEDLTLRDRNRYDIVTGAVEVDGAKEEDAMDQTDDTEKGVPEFWLTAMKHNEITAEEITERDEEALKYLKDIKWCRMDDPNGFKLEFFFDTNPFFTNSILTKIYHMIDDDEPILEKAIGTTIEWLPGKCLTQKILKRKPKKGSKNAKPITKTEDCESFFNFFSPPEVPDDAEEIEEDMAEELQNQMEQDYDIGSTIRDKIIPHAVSWFMGEANQEDFGVIDVDFKELILQVVAVKCELQKGGNTVAGGEA
ncbi:nucleosome assembly protein 1,4 [Artemisia annua]|uniref:Nucleosome assembly protein 1,4 n=1 Tax=Artemisia annua TaxID=35608 RepID=A0A2U1N6T1_ARTAN|nr:nucleosome assembly protein 1,4 [Artemisia annua]